MATLGKTTITDLSVYNTIHGKIEQADKVTITSGSSDAWRNMLVTAGSNDIFSVPNVYANYSLGALKAKSVYISGSGNNTTGFISSDTTSNMYFSLNGVIPLVIDTSSTTNPIIRPSNSLKNSVDLGTSANGWNNIYGKTLYENGTSLAGKYAVLTHTHTQYATSSHTHTSFNNIVCFNSDIHLCNNGDALGGTIYFGDSISIHDTDEPRTYIQEAIDDVLEIYADCGIKLEGGGKFSDIRSAFLMLDQDKIDLGIKSDITEMDLAKVDAYSCGIWALLDMIESK